MGMAEIIQLQQIGLAAMVVLIALIVVVMIIRGHFQGRENQKIRLALLEKVASDIRPNVANLPLVHLTELAEGRIAPEQAIGASRGVMMVGLTPTIVRAMWGAPNDVDIKGGKTGEKVIWKWYGRGSRGTRTIAKKVTFIEDRVDSWER